MPIVDQNKIIIKTSNVTNASVNNPGNVRVEYTLLAADGVTVEFDGAEEFTSVAEMVDRCNNARSSRETAMLAFFQNFVNADGTIKAVALRNAAGHTYQYVQKVNLVA